MKNFFYKTFIIITLTLLCVCSFASEENNSYEYQKGERVHYAWSYGGVTDLPGEIAAYRSNDIYIIRLDEEYNDKKYLINTSLENIYSATKCTTFTDDGSKLCAGSIAISFSYSADVTIKAVNNYSKTVLVDYQGTLLILETENLILVQD